MLRSKFFPSLFMALLWGSLFGQGFEARTFVSADSLDLPYRILYPEDYDPSGSYPLLLFLHGAGERGADNEAQLTHGASLFLDPENRKNFPAIVVFPQCARESYWVELERDGAQWTFPFFAEPNPQLGAVMELLDQLLREEAVDPARQYVMGLSMGGFGTFELLARQPERFAAAVPICGGGNRSLARAYAPHTALWVFHGGKDDIVPPRLSREMVRAIRVEPGSEVRYTEFPDANHNSWDSAFAEPELLPWLFSHRSAPREYLRPVWDSVQVTTHQYAEVDGQALELDLYRPGSESKVDRPLLLYVHGGGFAGGRRDEFRYSQFARQLAQRGYLVASISYRLTMKGRSFGCDQAAQNKLATFRAAAADIHRAVGYLLDEPFGIDGDKVVLAGSSAGAEAILHAAYWPAAAFGSALTDFRPAGVISMAGALVDTALIRTDNAVPTLLFHGTCDPLVPYGSAPHHFCPEDAPGYLPLDGALSIAQRLHELDRSYGLLTGCGGGHEWNDRPLRDQVEEIVNFLYYQVLEGKFAQWHHTVEQTASCDLETNWPNCPGERVNPR